MAVRFSYRQVNVPQVLGNEWQLGQASDNVVISIYDMTDNAADVSSAAMTNETGGLFSYSWTPTDGHTFRIDYFNQTLDSHDYELVSVTGSPGQIPSASGGGSTLTTLRTKFLKLIDNYNASDLTGTNSSGEVADLCLNDALQIIYSIIKSTRNMQAYTSTSLVSVAGQDYIELSGISDLDEVRAIRDTTNQWTLTEISPDQYFRWSPDPSAQTGVPTQYCRIFNRVYLFPRPNDAITYSTEYIKTYPRLVNDNDQALIPTKFDDWILKEARVIWFMMEDPRNMPDIITSERNEAREIYLSDMMSDFDMTSQTGSAFFRIASELKWPNWPNGPWDRLV